MNIATKKVMKHDVDFSVADFGENDINNFCISEFSNGNWEEHSFYIFDKYRNQSKTMIDMGGWLGITPLYCSYKFNKVVAFECDPEALKRFKYNLTANPSIKNIYLSEEAIWHKNGEISLYAQGELGNSESTLVPMKTAKEILSSKNKLKVKCTTFLSAMNKQRINLKTIGFIKIDIEGAEAKVIKDMKRFLSVYKPTIYLSIHHNLLTSAEIDSMLTFLQSIYNIPTVFSEDGNAMEVTKEFILDNEIGDCVFSTY